MNREPPSSPIPELSPDGGAVGIELRISAGKISGAGGELPLHEADSVVRDFLLLLLHEAGGLPLKRALELFGYHSRATYYTKRRRYQHSGVEGLLHRRPGPRSKWRRSGEVIRRVIAMRQRDPDCTAGEIAASLQHAGLPISVRSVERTLSEYGLTGTANR